MKFRVLALALMVLAQAGPANADDGPIVNPVTNGFGISLSNQQSFTNAPTSESNEVTPTFTETESEPGLDEQFCGGVNWTPSCDPPETPVEQPVITGEMVSQAFAYTPLPPSTLIIQPPNGRTLVNFDTNFYTDAPAEHFIPVTLLGQTIELRVWPASFTWNFGDGATTQTTERGAAYPALDITHKYLQKGEVAPSLDTTYAAEWRLLGNGAWQPVQGTVTIAGEPSALQVLTATPTLVG